MSGGNGHNSARGSGRGARGGRGNSNRRASPPPVTQPRVSLLATRARCHGAAPGQEEDSDKPAILFLKVNQPPPHFTTSMHVAWGHVKDLHTYPTKRTRAAPKWQTDPTLKLCSCRLCLDNTHKTPHQHLISNIKPCAHRKRCCFLFVLLKSWNTETKNPVRLRPQASETFRTSRSSRLPITRPSDYENTLIHRYMIPYFGLRTTACARCARMRTHWLYNPRSHQGLCARMRTMLLTAYAW